MVSMEKSNPVPEQNKPKGCATLIVSLFIFLPGVISTIRGIFYAINFNVMEDFLGGVFEVIIGVLYVVSALKIFSGKISGLRLFNIVTVIYLIISGILFFVNWYITKYPFSYPDGINFSTMFFGTILRLVVVNLFVKFPKG